MSAITILNDPLATGGTFPQDVDDAGEIVGYYIDGQGSHGFTYSNGSFSSPQNVITAEGINNSAQIVGSTHSGASVQAYGINNAGQVVGSFTDPNGATQAFITTCNTGLHHDQWQYCEPQLSGR